jgi:hypothetical protein
VVNDLSQVISMHPQVVAHCCCDVIHASSYSGPSVIPVFFFRKSALRLYHIILWYFL